MIIDTHLHLNAGIDGTAESAAAELDTQLARSGIDQGIVLQLEAQPWSAEMVAEALAPYPRLKGFINIHPQKKNAGNLLREGIEKLGYIGLKLHPRLQEFDINDEQTVKLVRTAGEMNIPVIIDAFPDGTHLLQGFSALKYAKLAQTCPGTNIVCAHMGGHHVVDFMMLAKRLPNMYFDISYSLLYYQKSSTPREMVYAMSSMKYNRIFYGSDYPDRSVAETLSQTLDFLVSEGVIESDLDRIMGLNALRFFKLD